MSRRPEFLSPRFLAALSLALLTVTFAFCRIRPIYWGDVWWHMGAGNYIVSHAHVPTVDVFSWTARGTPWINTEWLYEVVLYGFFRVLGLAGPIFLKTMLMLVSLYFMDRRLRLWNASVFERIFFLGLAFLGGWPFWVERTDLSSLALLSALFYEIDRSWSKASGFPRRAWVWVILFSLWPNIHGAYPVGLAVLGLSGVIRFSGRFRSGHRVLLWTLLCAAATFVNPYGLWLPFRIFQNMSLPLNQVYEWLPPSGLGFLFFYLLLFLSLGSLVQRPWSRQDVYAVLIVLLFGGYALCHQRFVHFFAIGAFPYAARRWLASSSRNHLSERLRPWKQPALILCSAILFVTAFRSARLIQGGVDAVHSGCIKEACDFIKAQNVQGPFYNDYFLGSYWIWRFQGDPPVFQDSRHLTVQGYDRLISECLQAQKSPPAWQVYADRMGIQAALVRRPPNSRERIPPAFDRFFPRTTWGLVYGDDLCLLFVRRTPAQAALLRRWEPRAGQPEA